MSIYKNKHFDVIVDCLSFFPFIFLVIIDFFFILSGYVETNYFSGTRCHCILCVNKQLYHVVSRPTVLLNNAKGCSITFLACTISWDFWIMNIPFSLADLSFILLT